MLHGIKTPGRLNIFIVDSVYKNTNNTLHMVTNEEDLRGQENLSDRAIGCLFVIGSKVKVVLLKTGTLTS
jgi:hypothetical protein